MHIILQGFGFGGLIFDTHLAYGQKHLNGVGLTTLQI
jgi:hypothetical protein